jgi:hypothetical protein
VSGRASDKVWIWCREPGCGCRIARWDKATQLNVEWAPGVKVAFSGAAGDYVSCPRGHRRYVLRRRETS